MDIRNDPHTLERAAERGASAEEIIDVITSGQSIAAKRGRSGKSKVFDFTQTCLGSYYEQKKIEVFFAIEGDVIVTVTVYVFYGKWEIDDGDSV
jgi:Domain of unknown function (DUF4258)